MPEEIFSDKTMYVIALFMAFVIVCLVLTDCDRRFNQDKRFNNCIKNHSVVECTPLLKNGI